jgi:hypothetical protein
VEFGSFKGDLSGQIILLSEARNRGIYVITSTTEYELSFENRLSRHGEFTKHLLEGIKSWKAVDKYGNITIGSLYSYIYKKMLRQKPMFHSSKVEGEIIFAGKRAWDNRSEQDGINDPTSLVEEDDEQNEIESNNGGIITSINKNKPDTLNDIDETNDSEDEEIIIKTCSNEAKTAFEKRSFLKRMDDEARNQDQELSHLMDSEREIEDQIETEVLQREQDSFLRQLDIETSNDIDETNDSEDEETIIEACSN